MTWMYARPWRSRRASRCSIETVQLDGPKAGEVLIEVKATGICHTDKYTLSGADPEGPVPLDPRPRGRGHRRGGGPGRAHR